MLRILTAAAVAALILPAAAQAQTSIAVGQPVRGQLTRSDPALDDGSHYRCYRLQTRAGERYQVDLRSQDFDAYLAVVRSGRCDASGGETDDDGGGGTDSRIQLTGDGGVWLVRANTLSGGETGAYTLSVTGLGTVRPPTVRPIQLGETLRGELDSGDPTAGDGSYFDCYAFTVRREQAVTATLRSDSFDAYLEVYEGGTCSGEGESDDDSGGGTDAELTTTLAPGTYSIRANSLGSGETGPYSLSVSAASRFADAREIGACAYRPGGRRLERLTGKADSTGSVLLIDGRETDPAAAGYTQAAGRSWFVDNDPVRIGGRTFVKYGLPRVLGFGEIEYFAEHDGIAFAAERGGESRPEVLYALVRGVGCEFQPYQVED